MTTFPKAVWKFIPWSKAMVAGATVHDPEYKAGKLTGSKVSRTHRKKRRKRRRRKNAKKD